MKRFLALLLCSALFGTAAFADGVSTGTSVTTGNSGGSSGLSLDRFYVGYYGNLEGSRIDDIGTPYQVSATGTPSKQAMTFASDATVAYMVTPDIGVGNYTEMNMTPVMGAHVQWLDVGVTTFDKKLISYRGFTLFGNAIVEVPTSSYDINRGMYAAYETTPYFRYQFPGSRFAVGSWNEIKNYAGSRTGKLVKTYWEPYVNYKLAPKFSANLAYELEWDHFAGQSGFSVYETDLQPGVIWNVSRKMLVNPYLQYFTNNSLTMDKVAFGATLVARVL